MNKITVKALLFDKDGTLARYQFTNNNASYLPEMVSLSKDLYKLFSTLTAKNIKIGIASRDTESNVKKMVEQFQLNKFISFIAGIDSGFQEKPNPEVAEEFLRITQTTGNEAMVVGDSPEDLILGERANFKYKIAVLNGYYAKSDLEHLASYTIPTVDHLMPML